jgi:Putative peptidoglycan binding domain
MREGNKRRRNRFVLVEGKIKTHGDVMNYKNIAAVTIGLAICVFAASNAVAQRHGGGGFGGGGAGFGRAGFNGGGFNRGGFNGGGFRGGFNGGGSRGGFSGRDFTGRGFRGDRDFRGDRFRHRHFNDFAFFGDFGDPFFYYPYYGYYPYGYYSDGYGYDSYSQSGYQSRADSVVGEVQVRLARAGYYHGAIDGVSGNGTRRAIRDYQRSHSLPADGQIRGRLLTSMGLG